MIASILAGAIASGMQEEELHVVQMKYRAGEVATLRAEYKDEVSLKLGDKTVVTKSTTLLENTYTIKALLEDGSASAKIELTKSETEVESEGKKHKIVGELGYYTGTLTSNFALVDPGDWVPAQETPEREPEVRAIPLAQLILDELHGAIPQQLPKRNFAAGDRWTVPIKNDEMFSHDSQWIVRTFGPTTLEGKPVFRFEWSFDGRFDMDITALIGEGYVGELPKLRLKATPKVHFIRSVDRETGWILNERGTISFDATIELDTGKSEQQAKSTWTLQRVPMPSE